VKFAVSVRLGALLVSTTLCASPAAPLAAQPEPVIRVGMTAGDAFAEAYYAQETGLFKKAGIRAEIRPFSTGAAISTGMNSDAIDVGISNVMNVSKAVARGAPFVLLAGGGMYSAKSPIVALNVLRDSPIRSARDLEGRTVAITALGDTAQVGIAAWMDRNGASASKVHFIELAWADQEAALENRLVDAVLATEPWLSAALKRGYARVLARPYDDIDSQFVIGVWFTTATWYAKNRTLAKRFADVIYQAGRWGNTHHEQSALLLAKYSKIDVQTIRSMTRAPYAQSLDVSLIQPQLNLAYRYHTIDRPIDASALIAR